VEAEYFYPDEKIPARIDAGFFVRPVGLCLTSETSVCIRAHPLKPAALENDQWPRPIVTLANAGIHVFL
jgi:hypothetical protein